MKGHMFTKLIFRYIQLWVIKTLYYFCKINMVHVVFQVGKAPLVSWISMSVKITRRSVQMVGCVLTPTEATSVTVQTLDMRVRSLLHPY